MAWHRPIALRRFELNWTYYRLVTAVEHVWSAAVSCLIVFKPMTIVGWCREFYRRGWVAGVTCSGNKSPKQTFNRGTTIEV